MPSVWWYSCVPNAKCRCSPSEWKCALHSKYFPIHSLSHCRTAVGSKTKNASIFDVAIKHVIKTKKCGINLNIRRQFGVLTIRNNTSGRETAPLGQCELVDSKYVVFAVIIDQPKIKKGAHTQCAASVLFLVRSRGCLPFFFRRPTPTTLMSTVARNTTSQQHEEP